MTSFTGTQDKCKACDKTVYFVDLLSADGANYHKSCFKCSHCKGTLVMSNYSSMDGVLLNSFLRSLGILARISNLKREPSKLSSMFCGTQDKCPACNKTVYPLEKVIMEGESFHKSCFRCAHGGCPLTQASYAALDGILYCKHHFQQLFMEKGNYQHVIEAGRKSTAENDAHEVLPPVKPPETVPEEDEGAKPDPDEPESEKPPEE